MARAKRKQLESKLDQLLGEASWLLSHAESLTDYGRTEEAAAELARAAKCEEQVAYLLDAAGREVEAVTHRVSAASCYETLGQHARAATLTEEQAAALEIVERLSGTIKGLDRETIIWLAEDEKLCGY